MSATLRKMTAAQAIVECLKLERIEKVFCVPGESYLPLLDALYDEPSIDVISARHEGGASFMAEGYAKAALKPGVVMATRGVGAANLSIGVHTAYQDSTPMVVFLGQVHSKFRGREGFQEVDLDRFFQPIAKWTVEINSPDRIPEIVQRAFRIAQSGRPGPVVVSLPEDVLPIESKMQLGQVFNKIRPAPSEEAINHFQKLINKAKHPVILAGGGVKLSQSEEELVQFAETNSIPVYTAFRRHDVFPNDHPLYGGHLGLGTHPKIIQSVKNADVVLIFGTRLSEVTTQDYQLFGANHTLIHIDIDYDVVGKIYQPELAIIADLKELLKKLSQLKIETQWQEWAKQCNNIYKNVSLLRVTENDSIYHHVFDVLNKTLSKDTILTNDAGNFAGWLHSYYVFKEKHTYIGPTSGAMGYGLPAALGAKIANPDKTVIALSGDGGFMMTFAELETAVRHQIPIISLVFNNRMYGTIRMHQELTFPNRVIATELGEISFKGLAENVGAIGYCVNNRGEFEYALNTALKNNTKPTVIEIVADQEQISVTKTITELRNR